MWHSTIRQMTYGATEAFRIEQSLLVLSERTSQPSVSGQPHGRQVKLACSLSTLSIMNIFINPSFESDNNRVYARSWWNRCACSTLLESMLEPVHHHALIIEFSVPVMPCDKARMTMYQDSNSGVGWNKRSGSTMRLNQ